MFFEKQNCHKSFKLKLNYFSLIKKIDIFLFEDLKL